MTTIVTRSGKGSPLTHTEVDTNFTNLNTNKLETAAIPLGTAAAPSISFLSDADSGLFSPGANQVAVATNGTGRLFVDASGNIGVGTASPAQLLHVSGSGTQAIRLENTLGTGNVNLELKLTNNTFTTGLNNSSIYYNDTAGREYIWYQNSAERMRLDTSGRLGIGTSSVSNTAGFSQQLQLTGNLPCISIDNTGTGANKYSLGVNASAAFGIWDNTASAYRMYINSSGQVGIGTTSVLSLLHLSASALADFRFTDTGEATDQKNWAFQTGTGIGAGTFRLRAINDANNTGENAYLITKSGTSIQTHQWLTGGSERARIDSSGRLLVGTVTGNANGGILQLSGGITFPATAVAATDANTLDDYEEGTWTPSIGGDATYTSRNGTYTKVGRKVSILGSFVINIKGTGSATIVSDLPFAASALTPAYVGLFQNLAINVVFLLGTIPATTARIDFTSLSSAGGTAPNETSVIGNGTRIDFAATYFV